MQELAAMAMAEQQKFLQDDDAFVQGAQVEVCLDDHGFRGSWYSATVLETFNNNKNDNKILLKFHSLMTDDDEPLTEYVSVILVRPIPPRESRRAFFPDDEVDAFHNDGWWEGVVISAVPKDSKYTVFFRCSKEQIDFHESELRLHREWVSGKWVPPMEEDEEEHGVSSADDSSTQSHHRAERTTNGN